MTNVIISSFGMTNDSMRMKQTVSNTNLSNIQKKKNEGAYTPNRKAGLELVLLTIREVILAYYLSRNDSQKR
jgi:hypothetical protein